MTTENTRLHPEYRELVSAAIDWDYGSIHSHQEIAEIIGIPTKTNRFYSAVNMANKKLLDKQKMLVSVYNAGYKVALPGEYTLEVVRQIRLSKKRANQGLKVAQLAPVDRMTVTEQIRHRAVSDRALSYAAFSAGVVVEAKLLLSKDTN